MPTSSSVKRLVIVESPAKAKTIAGYLGPGYEVEASLGHIRDLARKPAELPEDIRKEKWARLSVNTDDDFHPYYVISPERKAKVVELRRKLKDADELFLATDEDREGEAISWHLLEVLRPKVPVKRMVFHEITREAIQRAVQDTRDVDMELVDAQETRRIIDRLYGFEISEVLWRKIGQNARSAGRVQSVAVRLVVDRERDRIAFVSASYADIEGTFNPTAGGRSFAGKLNRLDGAKLATSGDFDSLGVLKSGVLALTLAEAESLATALHGRPFSVRAVDEKPTTARPSAPFMTSSLQQEASRKLGWNAQRTMRVAQSLYENGWITYMRTDSTSLSQTALQAARSQAALLYGPDSIPPAPRKYDRKVKNAQEAHEAIRPAGDTFRTPAEASKSLREDDFRLYDLIWKRTIASQMVDARGSTTTLRYGAVTTEGRDAEFSTSGTVWKVLGFKAAYQESTDDEAADSKEDVTLPDVAVGDALDVRRLEAKGHATNPPGRYTEASLVKALEERGIGRPSTYASIMSRIVDAGYVWKKGSAMVPTWTAFTVTRLLEDHFPQLVDYGFTASLEERLDEVSNGDLTRLAALTAFYRGSDAIEFPGLVGLIAGSGEADPRALSTFPIPGSDITVRVGRYGPYVERGEERGSIPEDLAPDELTAEKAEELLAAPSNDRDLGLHPETGLMVSVKSGRFGPYVEEALAEGAAKSAKPRRSSLFKSMTTEGITLDDAVLLLGLPRVVGSDPESGLEITAQNGRYGPYIAKTVDGKLDARSLETEEAILNVTLDEALALFAQPRTRRGQNRAAASPLRELGPDPASGGPITVRDGRFGPYVTDGEYNATLRKGDDPATITPERAAELLAEKREKGPAPKKKAAAKKAPAKKAPAKKTAAKKAPAKKSAVEVDGDAASATAEKAPAKKSAAKKSAAKKAPAKKAAAKKAPATLGSGSATPSGPVTLDPADAAPATAPSPLTIEGVGVGESVEG